MSKSKYVDTAAIVQVIGAVYNNPSLLEMEDKYHFNEEDFTEEFHQVLFGALYNLHTLGVNEITLNAIEDYLSQRPKKKAIYDANKGPEYLEKIKDNTQVAAFDYYYNRMKKMTLLRMYDKVGMNLSWLYDVDNIFDAKKKQTQEDWLDNTPIEEIADTIDKRITNIRLKYVDNTEGAAVNAGDGVLKLIERLKQVPDVGYPLFGQMINTITRGARLKRFYLRSASTGVGKTRSMIADACYIGCAEMWDLDQNQWVKTGTPQGTLYVTTEQEMEEIQTMCLAFLSAVDETHIMYGHYDEGEEERVIHAAQLMEQSKLYIKELPDFSIQDVENTIKSEIMEHETRYVFHDYVHSSIKILSEISSKTKVSGLREDNILFMISTKLKDICNKYGVFIMTATQLNGNYVTADKYDQNLLRGAKGIADKIDLGAIMLEVSQEDKEALANVIQQGGFEEPTVKMSIYKNRRGRYKDILLWCKTNRGICRIEPMFATNYQYELVQIDDMRISIKEESAF